MARFCDQVSNLGLGDLPFQAFEFIFNLPLLVHKPVDRSRDFRSWSPESLGKLMEKVLVLLESKISSESGQCFDSPDSRCNARFGHDFEKTHIAGHPGMRAATEFDADLRNGNHTDLLLIFFAKES